ncbi:hypothetical protein K440DRAFT_668786 [Wilcoxina mikolae CBS 423.85]|nr:hypothetical protein K440DRAFT_668786 [Wilcoxina mikolae CBS 423.85]
MLTLQTRNLFIWYDSSTSESIPPKYPPPSQFIDPDIMCSNTAPANYILPLSQSYRSLLHKFPHTSFVCHSSVPGLCTSCDSIASQLHRCTTCPLTLCTSCRDVITSPLVRGNLRSLISIVARWKLGYSASFLAREEQEVSSAAAERNEAKPRCKELERRRCSSLRWELLSWMLWEDEDDGVETDRSDDSVYSDEVETGDVEEERGVSDLSAFQFPGMGALAVARMGLMRGIDKPSPTEVAKVGGHRTNTVTLVGAMGAAGDNIVRVVDVAEEQAVLVVEGEADPQIALSRFQASKKCH